MLFRSRFDELQRVKYERELSQTEKKECLGYLFYQSFGYNLNFDAPITYNEKLNWLKIYYQNPQMQICADKATFPSFLENQLPAYAEHCVDALTLFHAPEEVTDDAVMSLPQRFFMKSNFGSGTNSIIEKSSTSVHKMRETVAAWLNPHRNHYYLFLENSYKDIVPAVLCEPIVDYKYKIEFFCFDGEPAFYWIIIYDKTSDMGMNFYSMKGERLPVRRIRYPNFAADPKPRYFNELVDVSRVLSAGFPHVRVDFYAASKTWYFSEMTFYPGAGLTPFSDYNFDIALGAHIDLEKWRAAKA